ncbi:MAG: DUF4255 domain-containing protein [Novosphingobium sp.]|nr:DUF4255 domain-containing protein [Novosphingobium sp.]
MSDYRSIAVVTAALSDIVRYAVQDVIKGVEVKVEIGPPKAITGGETVVNIYVYRVSPNPQLRNSDLPRYGTNERPGTLPTAAVDLHYVIAFGSDAPLATDLLMGRVVALLHACPGIGRARLRQMLGKGGAYHALAGSGMAEAHDLVTFTPEYLSLDELSKLWTVFFQLAHRPSLQYIASPVLLSWGHEKIVDRKTKQIAFTGLE